MTTVTQLTKVKLKGKDNVIGIGEQFFFAALHQNLYAASTSKGNPQLFANINLS